MHQASPEMGVTINAAGWQTNVHDTGTGQPVMLIHGSGPGVTGWQFVRRRAGARVGA